MTRLTAPPPWLRLALTRRDNVKVAERNANAALFELLYLGRQAQPSMHRLLPNRKGRQRKARVGEGPDGDAAVIWEPARTNIRWSRTPGRSESECRIRC